MTPSRFPQSVRRTPPVAPNRFPHPPGHPRRKAPPGTNAAASPPAPKSTCGQPPRLLRGPTYPPKPIARPARFFEARPTMETDHPARAPPRDARCRPKPTARRCSPAPARLPCGVTCPSSRWPVSLAAQGRRAPPMEALRPAGAPRNVTSPSGPLAAPRPPAVGRRAAGRHGWAQPTVPGAAQPTVPETVQSGLRGVLGGGGGGGGGGGQSAERERRRDGGGGGTTGPRTVGAPETSRSEPEGSGAS